MKVKTSISRKSFCFEFFLKKENRSGFPPTKISHYWLLFLTFEMEFFTQIVKKSVYFGENFENLWKIIFVCLRKFNLFISSFFCWQDITYLSLELS